MEIIKDLAGDDEVSDIEAGKILDEAENKPGNDDTDKADDGVT